jgi:hypothetical protein
MKWNVYLEWKKHKSHINESWQMQQILQNAEINILLD